MTIVHTGSNKKYADNWEAAFGRKSKGKKTAKSKTRKPSASKKRR